MAEIVELVFENLLPQVVKDLTIRYACVNVLSVTYNGQDICDKWSAKSVPGIVHQMKPGDHLFANVESVNLGEVVINNCSNLILNLESGFDYNLVFDEADVILKRASETLPMALQASAQEIAKVYGINSYFGGLEPARDLETRFFTMDEIGPLA